MKKTTLLVLSSAFLLSCGQNAALEKITAGVLLPVKNEKSNEINIQIDAKDINLGLVELNKKVELPVLIKNTGIDVVEKIILTSQSRDIKALAIKDAMIESGETLIATIELTKNQIGNFEDQITIDYQTRKVSKAKKVKILGEVTSDDTNVGTSVEPNKPSDREIDFGTLPINSKYNYEIILKSIGLSTALITDISIESGTHFQLVDNADSCVGQLASQCSLKVLFEPLETGTHRDNLIIKYSDATGVKKVLKIKLKGQATNQQQCLDINEVAHIPLPKRLLNTDNGKVELPYKITSSKTDLAIVDLHSSDHNQEVKAGDSSIYYVKDAQVIAVFDLEAKRKAGDVVASSINTNMLKSVDKSEYARHKTTEVICFENAKICSGQRFLSNLYKNHINTNYVVDGKSFSNAIIRLSKVQTLNGVELLSLEKDFSIAELYPTKKLELFSKLKTDSHAKIIFADDIRLDDTPQLNVKYKNVIDELSQCR